jgi:hypothetical protein
MTKAEFKAEVIADLEYQLAKKGRPFTSEAWYLSNTVYPLKTELKDEAIAELIAEGLIRREPSTEYLNGREPFPLLVLN